MPDICARLVRYYDELLIDEVQGFSGDNFNCQLDLCNARLHRYHAAAEFISIPSMQVMTTMKQDSRCKNRLAIGNPRLIKNVRSEAGSPEKNRYQLRTSIVYRILRVQAAPRPGKNQSRVF